MFGRRMSEGLGKLHFWITFVGVNAIFMPMHFLGIEGHPRRYAELSGVNFLAQLQPLQMFITIAAFITIAGQFIFLFNFCWSLFKGRKAEMNPWNATTLEWEIPSPPPHDNFGDRQLLVHHGPYEYSVPGRERDFVMQTEGKGEGTEA